MLTIALTPSHQPLPRLPTSRRRNRQPTPPFSPLRARSSFTSGSKALGDDHSRVLQVLASTRKGQAVGIWQVRVLACAGLADFVQSNANHVLALP